MALKRKITHYTEHNRVRLVRGGKEYFDLLLQLIAEAKESIHLQTYIYDDDETGQMVTEALKDAVKRKVDVRLMIDGYASRLISGKFITLIRESGIHLRFFEPLLRSKYFYFGRRMHHKIFVVDAKYALVGGMNIADRYNDMPEQPAWLDFALFVEGETAKDLCVLCWKTWKGFPVNMGLTPCEKKPPEFNIPPEERCKVRMLRNDWVRRKNDISKAYISNLVHAKKQMTIMCSYFLPGKILRRQLIRAVNRGVKIRLIVAGISDVMLAKNAERWLYDWLLRRGIELYEYQKNVLHCKIGICDDEWFTVGSYNLNDLSAYASLELNLDVNDPTFVKKVREVVDEIINHDCERILPENLKRTRNIFTRFGRWLSYQFIRLMIRLFTFYLKRHK